MNKNAFFRFSYGVYVISTMDKNRPTGCIANSVMQITSEPATLALSINCDNYTNKCIKECKRFAICILGEKTNPRIIGDFGFRTGKDCDKFANVKHSYKNNLPVCDDICAYFTCKVVNTLEAGTHTIFLGEVEDCDVISEDAPMTYSFYHNVIKGKSPKNAPTYIAP